MNTYVKVMLTCCLYLFSAMSTICAQDTPATAAQAANMPQQPSLAGQAMPEMSEEQFEKELEEALKFLSTLSEEELEELEKLGREILVNEGIDPDTLEPIDQAAEPAEKEEPEPSAPETITKKPLPQISAQEKTAIAQMVSQVIYHAESLIQKSTTKHGELSSLKAWNQDLQNLIALLLILNKSKHISRLADKKYTNLLQLLQNLHTVLHTYEPQLKTHGPDIQLDQDNPYEILDIQQDASQQTIDSAFEKRSKEFDTQELRKKLTEQGLSEKDIKRKTKQAQLDFGLIEDAYERISDPKARKQVDRQLMAHQERIATVAQQNKAISEKITAGLSQSIYTDNLVGKLEDFLQEYEPEELAKKKKREEQEKARIKEQQKLAQRAPLKGPFGKLDPEYKIPKPKSSPSTDSDDFDLDTFQKEWDALFGSDDGTKKDDEAKKASEKTSQEKETKGKKDEKPAEAAKKKAEIKKAHKRFKSVTKLLDDITKSLETFKKAYNQEPFSSFLKDLPKYTHPSTKDQKSTPAQKQKPDTQKDSINDPDDEWAGFRGLIDEGEKLAKGEKKSAAKKKPQKSVLDQTGPEVRNQLALFAEKTSLDKLLIDLDDLNKKLTETITPDQKIKYKTRWKTITGLQKETIDQLQKNIDSATSPIYKGTQIKQEKLDGLDPELKMIRKALKKILETSREVKKHL